jgi:O-antigen/teichoic acid export membrane protein
VSQPSLRRNIAYSILGRGAYVGTQFATLIIVARLGTPTDVGALALASAIVTPMFFLTSMGLRDVHTVDDLTQRSRADYVMLRLLGGSLAVILSMGAVLFLYGASESLLVGAAAGFALIKFFGAQTSLNHGIFQRAERLDFVALSNLGRAGGGLLAFATVFAATRSLPLALLAEAFLWFLSYLVVDQPLLRRVGGTTGVRDLIAVRMRPVLLLLWWLLPVGLALWLMRAAVSAPPILLARHADLETVGIFGAIAYAYSAVAMLSGTVGGASAARMRRFYRNGNRAGFVSLTLRLVAFSAMVGAGIIAVGVAAGDAMLGVLFGTSYMRGDLLVIMLLAAAIGISVGPLVTGLQAGQAFRRRLLTGLAGFITAWGTAILLVPGFGEIGAAWSLVAMATGNAVMTIILYATILRDMPRPPERQE